MMSNKALKEVRPSGLRHEEANAKKAATHILVIRLSAMGDVAILVPVLRTLVATYPQLKITVLTQPFFAPIFKEIPNTSVYEADVKGIHSGIAGLGRLAKELRDEEIEVVADLHNVLRSNILKSFFYLFGIPVKQINKGRAEKKALTRSDNKIFKQLKSTHQRYADVFHELGYPIDLREHKFPQKQKLSESTWKLLGKEPKKWLGIAPFAQHASKCYPADLAEEVLRELDQDFRIKILLFGGDKAEREQLELWEQKFKNIIAIAGKTSFEEELALISNLDAMLSMDSGNAHLAAMFGIPVITLWGVTHPYAGFAAFAQPAENNLLPDLREFPQIPTSVYGNKYPEGYEKAMRSISPKAVVKKVRDLLF